ncbi:MFS transporter [Mycolicibacterium nivoides]|uniref:MFS transporter n=1 Tax=Mycolicibacterium nivoides TaxID=2487344 RepID=UPI003C2D5DBB
MHTVDPLQPTSSGHAGAAKSIDDAPLTSFHAKIAAFASGGFLVDGYILGSVGPALPLISEQMSLSSVWQGALGASAFIGIFVGSLVFGVVTDKAGRRAMMIVDMLVVVGLSLAQLFVDGPLALLLLRLALGAMCGAEYTLAPALLSEFAPSRSRGRMLSSLTVSFTVGFALAYGVGAILADTGHDAWRWMLATSAVPALIVLLLRFRTPESPRWLASVGRIEEARAVVNTYFGPQYSIDEPGGMQVRTSYRELFGRRYAGRTVFAGVFWACQVFPYFALGTFLPSLLVALGIHSGILGELLFNVVLLTGAILGWLYIDRIGRRPLTIWSFVAIAGGLAILGIFHDGSMWLLVPVFLVLALVIAASANLEAVYPAEIFPTEIRATGAGFAAGFSRIGAAISTFILPTVLHGFGIAITMLMLAAVALLGAAISIPLAPETNGVALRDASRG